MAYIGQALQQGTFKVLDTSGNTYSGSNVTFSLGTQVGSAAQLLVSHDGVIQKPVTDYTIATGGTQITFTTAPASGASIFITEISGAVGAPMNRDINGDELILDADPVKEYGNQPPKFPKDQVMIYYRYKNKPQRYIHKKPNIKPTLLYM